MPDGRQERDDEQIADVNQDRITGIDEDELDQEELDDEDVDDGEQ